MKVGRTVGSTNDPIYRDMCSAREHRSYGKSWQEIHDDLKKRLPELSEEAIVLSTNLLDNWFTTAKEYWSD